MIRLLLAAAGPEQQRTLRRLLTAMVAAAVLHGVAFALLVPILRELLSGDTGRTWPWLVVLGGVWAAGCAAQAISLRLGSRTGAGLSRGLHHRIGDHVATLPVGWFDTERVGELSVLATRDVLGVMSVPADLLRPLVAALVTPAAVVAAMYLFDWRLAVIATITMPALVAVYRWSTARADAADAARHRTDAEAAARVVELVRAQPALRAFGVTRRDNRLTDALHAQHQHSGRILAGAIAGRITFTLAVQAAFTLLAVTGTYLALERSLPAPELLALLALAARFAEPLAAAAALGTQLRTTQAALSRIHDLLAAAPLPEPDQPHEPAGTHIELDHVDFAYGDTPVLHDITFTAPERSVTALVGPSGSGKTTVTRLAARFWDPTAGTVRIGGTDVRDIPTDTLMAHISMVFQDVYLFDGTIEDNVRLGRPAATTEQIRQAARQARLDEVVERLPDGWHTRVGERGAALSGGERQRVSIARALLKDAPIVLLDETTSALDPASEAAVQQALAALTADRTLVVVAHRLHTIATADQILVLDDGHIVERGTHTELLERDGRYATLWHERKRARSWRITSRPPAQPSPDHRRLND